MSKISKYIKYFTQKSNEIYNARDLPPSQTTLWWAIPFRRAAIRIAPGRLGALEGQNHVQHQLVESRILVESRTQTANGTEQNRLGLKACKVQRPKPGSH